MRFEELSKKETSKVELEILDKWKKEDILNKTIENRKDAENWVFYDGPATANGKPGIHHMVAKELKDTFCKYKTMKGYRVLRKVGWDTHGLPVEVQVEKQLGFSGKKDIEEYGIEAFNQKCRESVWENETAFRDLTDKMGQFIDIEHPYITYDNNYIETEWWILKKFFDEGLLYNGFKVTPYCPRCGTSLSSHEVAQEYKEISVNTITVPFKVKGEEDTYLLVWTTTPWTLLANVAACVNPKFEYIKAELDGKKYIVGSTLADKVLGEGYTVLETYKGTDLEGIEYEQFIPELSVEKKAFYVTVDDYVTDEDGTGIVHIAPAFGVDDNNVGMKYDLPVLNPVGPDGKYIEGPWVGRLVVDPELEVDIIKYLAADNKIFKKQKIMHNYPHCWRCKTPLIYKSMDAWYFNIEKVKTKLIAKNEEINWIPETVKQGRFGNWLNNARDWNISRNRYWSTPIPIWECDECGRREVLGSIQEIADVSGIKLENLHRQYMDKVTYKCNCGGTMKRVPEVLDCWFESASVPFAQKHYPFENKEWFESHFPCDFIVEYTGQIRCWFYYLHVLAVALFDKPAFKNCVVHGTILAKDGKKLSKSSKNYTDPMELMKKYGTDAFRLYLFRSNAIVMNDLYFDENGIKSQVQQVLLPLYNCAKFFNSYAVLDNFEPYENKIPTPTNELDKWILAKLYDTEKQVEKCMEEYQIDKYVEPIIDLLDGFSNWYIRRSRRRFWSTESSQDKQDAYETTFYVLVSLCKLLAPITPVVAEKLYKHFTGKESVHLANVPNVPEQFKNEKILKETEVVQRIISLARFLREKENIKNRQPLSKIELAFTNPKYKQIVKDFEDIICEEINVKQIEIVESVEELAKVEYVPNFKTIGPKFGSKVSKITGLVKTGNFKTLDDGYEVNVDDEVLKLDLEDIIVRYTAKGENKIESDKDIIARLDTVLTEELKDEGIAREIVRNIQDARKQLNCEISDRIKLKLDGELSENSKVYTCNETLADLVDFDEADFECVVKANEKIVGVKIQK